MYGGTELTASLIGFVIAMAISQIVPIAHSSAIAITCWLALGICGYASVTDVIDFSPHCPLSLNTESAQL